MKRVLFIIFIILSAFSSYASHISGGDISYECLSDGRYVITLNLFRDCNGISISSSQTVDFKSACGGSLNASLAQISSEEVSQLCATEIQNSTCNGGALTGMEHYLFRDTISLNPSCENWTISWNKCCRNTTVNVTGSGTADIWIETTLNQAVSACNASPVFTSPPIPFVCINQAVDYNYGAFDPEGDSIVFSLVSALDQNAGSSTPVTYATGYSATLPFSGVTINPLTGSINFTPTVLGNFIVVVQVTEYDANGNLLGTVMRDIQFVVQNCNNTPPTLSNGGITNVTGTATSTSNTVTMECPGESVCFDIGFGDNNSTNVISFTSNIDSILPGAIVTSTGTNPITVHVCYTFTPGAKGGPAVFSFNDNSCPIPGINNFAILFKLPQPTVAGPDVSICGNLSAPLNAAVGTTFTWSVVSGFPIIVGTNFSCNPCSNPVATPKTTTTYLVTSDLSGCANKDTVVVNVLPNLGDVFATATPVDTTICIGDCVQLQGIATQIEQTAAQLPFNATSGAVITNANTPTVSTISVSGLANPTISGGSIESVCLDLTHSWDADLDMFLICPDGNRFELSTDNGGSGDNYTNTCFTIGATNPITAGAAPFTGNFVPEGGTMNNALIGCAANGIWSLEVTDDSGGDDGILISWSIVFNDKADFLAPADSFYWAPSTGLDLPDSLNPIACITNSTQYVFYSVNPNHCYDSSIVNINVVSSLTLVVDTIQESCIGSSDGAFNITVTGGSSTYLYTWSNGASTQNTSGLTSGTYFVTVQDLGGCALVDTLILTPPIAISVTLTSTNSNCGNNNGSANVIPTGGQSPYTYAWGTIPVQSSATATALLSNSYTVTVSDNLGCTSVFSTNVNDVGGPTVATLCNDASAIGASDGSSVASASAGSTPYTYSWSPAPASGQTTSIATGLNAGIYTVSVIDIAGCVAVSNCTINQPPCMVTATNTGTDASCFGGSSGTTSAVLSGGLSPYTYIWSDNQNQTTQTATGLLSAIYTVTITDVNLCFDVATITISEATPVIVTVTGVDLFCGGNSSGSATAVSTGGSSPYTYLWQNGATTNPALGLSAGVNNVSATDILGCTGIGSVNLNEPPPITTSVANISCNNFSDGSINLTVSGGNSPYIYLWDNGTTSTSISGLDVGAYTATVTDSKGCFASITENITQPVGMIINVVATLSTCGLSDGTASVNVGAGVPSFNFIWDDPLAQATPFLTNVPAGVYNVTVTDGNGCTKINSATILDNGAPTLSIINQSDALCFGNSDGSAEIGVNGGTSPFSYLWSDGLNQTTIAANSLSNGNYTATVFDAANCIASILVTISEPTIITPIMSSDSVTCPSGGDGKAIASLSGGTSPYTYLWNDGLNQTNFIAPNLTSGDYVLSVTDNNACLFIATVTVPEPLPINLVFNNTNASCQLPNGTSCATINNGVFPYTYLWSDGQIGPCAVTILAGNYTLTITDSRGCVASQNTTIFEPAPLTLDSLVQTANCGQADGSACVVVQGGISPYSYLWNNNQTTTCIANATASTYTVTVTDVNNCVISSPVVIPNTPGLSISITSVTDALCFGNSNGAASVVVSGAKGNFVIDWLTCGGNSINLNAPSVNTLGQGCYSVQVTDSVSCVASALVNIGQPDSIQANLTIVQPSCFGTSDGTVDLGITGGTTPYIYSWNDGNNQTTATATGLNAASYIAVVTDSNSCTQFVDIVVDEPFILAANISFSNVSCNGVNNGTITILPTEGNFPFTYTWSNGNSSATATGLPPAVYFITVIDNNNCFITKSTTITEPPLLITAITNTQNLLCNSQCNGFIEVTPTGGITPYSYLWDDGQTTKTAVNLCAGNHVITVTDTQGCTRLSSQILTEPSAIVESITKNNSICFSSCNGNAAVTVSGGVSPYQFVWDVTTGLQQTAIATALCGGVFKVSITDANACYVVDSVSISEPTEILLNIIADSSNCSQSNGNITVVANGGVVPYNTLWNDPLATSTLNLNNIPAGTYTLSITDANNCFIDTVISINDINGPVVSLINSSNIKCNGDCNGVITINVSGGTGSPTILWTNETTNSPIPALNGLTSITNLCAADYSVEIADQAGCFVNLTQTIIEPGVLVSAINSSTNVLCFSNSTGNAVVSVASGTSPYSYFWNDATNQTTASADNLVAGNYVVSVTDANNCSVNSSVLVSEPPLFSAIFNKINASCNALCNGSVAITTSGGVLPYIYNWNPVQTNNPNVANLCAGDYDLKVIDNNGCIIPLFITITEPLPLAASISMTASFCSAYNGTASIVNTTGGTSPYSYSWSDVFSQNSATATGLLAGNYNVTLSDANNCSIPFNTFIPDQPSPIIQSSVLVNPSCFASSNGTITPLITGGTSPLAYKWNDPLQQSGAAAQNLIGGIFCLTVTDSNGCTDVKCDEILTPVELIAESVGSAILCYNKEATIWGIGKGGTTPYDVIWIDQPTWGGIVGPHLVSPTTNTNYCFEITDANNCKDNNCVSIVVPKPLNVATVPAATVCIGGDTLIEANGTGGETPNNYCFTWTGVGVTCGDALSQILVNPTDTTVYRVILADGCAKSDTAFLTVNVSPLPIPVFAPVISEGCPPFEAVFFANSNIANSTFNWDFNSDGIIDSSITLERLNNPDQRWTYDSSGVYDVTLILTSEGGCSSSATLTDAINVFPAPNSIFTATPQTTTLTNSLINFDASLSTNYNNLTWSFDDGKTGEGIHIHHTYNDTGIFKVILTSLNNYNCIDTAVLNIHIKPDHIIYAPSAFTPNGDDLNDTFFPIGIGFTNSNIGFYVYNRWGQMVFESHDKNNQWDGRSKSSSNLLEAGIYIWKLKSFDFNGKEIKDSQIIGTVTLIR